jgi:hypothetical protein
MRHLAVALIVAAGCSHRVYSPPTQLFAVTPIAALPQGAQALDVDVSSHTAIFDPPVHAGAARLRHGLGQHTEMSIEGNAAAVRERGVSTAPRAFYTGRAGVRTNPTAGAVTLFAGAGGGISGAQKFVAGDGGLSIGYQNCVLVPTFQASGFISKPIDGRAIDVTTDAEHPRFDTPTTTLGGVMRAGARLNLSPSACRRGEQTTWLVAGLGVTWMKDVDSDTAIPGVGIGIEIPLGP